MVLAPQALVSEMPTFSPPTYEQAFTRSGASPRYAGLMPRYYGFNVGYSVLISGGVATPYPGRKGPPQEDIAAADVGSGYAGKAAFIGGRAYTITAGEQAILEAAGYTVT